MTNEYVSTCPRCGLQEMLMNEYTEIGLDCPNFNCDACQKMADEEKKSLEIEKREKLEIARFSEKIIESNLRIEFCKWDRKIGNNNLLDKIKIASLDAGNLFIYGKNGVCKTRAVNYMAFAKIKSKKDYVIKFIETNLFMRSLRVAEMESAKSAQGLISKIMNVDLLIIDDFGKEKITDFVGATLFDIINYRYGKTNKRTWITSNFTLEKIRQNLGDNYGNAIATRIQNEYALIIANEDEAAHEKKK